MRDEKGFIAAAGPAFVQPPPSRSLVAHTWVRLPILARSTIVFASIVGVLAGFVWAVAVAGTRAIATAALLAVGGIVWRNIHLSMKRNEGKRKPLR